MGMYNEVYKSCPECSARCEIQIAQVVLGFGCFNLDAPQCGNIQELSRDEKKELAEYVEDETFYCKRCGHSFQVQVEVARGNTKVVI